MKQIRFNQSKDKLLRNYYTSGNYIDYITRPEATLNQPSFINLNTMELIDENQKNALKKSMMQLDKNQIVWDFVVSFDQKFCRKNSIYSVFDFSKAIKSSLEKFLETSKIDIDNLNIFGSLHKNTDNLHMHIGFFEKREKFISNNGNKQFHKIGSLGGSDVINFKEFGANVEKFVEDDKLFKNLRESRENLHKQLNNFQRNDLYAETISYFANNEIKTFMFNKLDDESKSKIFNLTNYIIETNPELKQKYLVYKDSLKNLYEIKLKRNQTYELDNFKNDDLNNWYKLQDEDIDIRNCNLILKNIKQDLFKQKTITNNQDLKTLEPDDMNKSSETILANINSVLCENVSQKINKKSHISFSRTKNNNLRRIKIKPHKNINAYIDKKEKFKMKKIWREIENAFNINISISMKIYQQMQWEKEQERISNWK